jgi:hypothetical protein
MKTTILSLALAVGSLRLVAANSPEDYVAHEWGTFTSVQGADGVPIEWNPLETTQLPPFVYDWNKPGLNRRPAGALRRDTKGIFVTLQRMETPVIYFYSDKARTVDVAVRFPQGLITEWYPQAGEIGPSAFPPNRLATALDGLVREAGLTPATTFASMFGKKGIPDSRIAWKNVRILPTKEGTQFTREPPTGESGNHYFAARETDSTGIEVRSPDHTRGGPEHEKFLFYRGVGNFKTPLQVTMNGATENDIDLRNVGADELRHLFVLAVHHGRGKFSYAERVPAGEHVNVELNATRDLVPLNELVPAISEAMSEALGDEGLYAREARAMVKTWRESWFEEEGLRVFYVLPRAWTDAILPLTLDPHPRELVRVMVGRAEVISPKTEWELLKQIVHFAEPGASNRQQAIAEVKELGLGRFIQPAVRRVLGNNPSREFNRTAWELVSAATRKLGNEQPLAAK